MTKIASRVVLIEALPGLTASAILRERAAANSKLEIHCGARVEAIVGKNHVEGVQLIESGEKRTMPVDGVFVQVGIEPDTDYLKGIVALDKGGQIIVDSQMETNIPYILTAGDIRSGSPQQVATAVGDGTIAAVTAERLLQKIE